METISNFTSPLRQLDVGPLTISTRLLLPLPLSHLTLLSFRCR